MRVDICCRVSSGDNDFYYIERSCARLLLLCCSFGL